MGSARARVPPTTPSSLASCDGDQSQFKNATTFVFGAEGAPNRSRGGCAPQNKTGTLREIQTANAVARNHPADGGVIHSSSPANSSNFPHRRASFSCSRSNVQKVSAPNSTARATCQMSSITKPCSSEKRSLNSDARRRHDGQCGSTRRKTPRLKSAAMAFRQLPMDARAAARDFLARCASNRSVLTSSNSCHAVIKIGRRRSDWYISIARRELASGA